MDTKSSEAQEGDGAGVGGQHCADSMPCPGKAGRKRKKPKEKEPVESLRYLAATLLESLRNHLLLQSVPDMRLPPMQIRFAKADP